MSHNSQNGGTPDQTQRQQQWMQALFAGQQQQQGLQRSQSVGGATVGSQLVPNPSIASEAPPAPVSSSTVSSNNNFVVQPQGMNPPPFNAAALLAAYAAQMALSQQHLQQQPSNFGNVGFPQGHPETFSNGGPPGNNVLGFLAQPNPSNQSTPATGNNIATSFNVRQPVLPLPLAAPQAAMAPSSLQVPPSSAPPALEGNKAAEADNSILPSLDQSMKYCAEVKKRSSDTYDKIPSKTQGSPSGPILVPCRSRTAPNGHNIKTAYLLIPDDASHGMDLICLHSACRNEGVKFQYCVVCQLPVAKRNFRKRHSHLDVFLDQGKSIGKFKAGSKTHKKRSSPSTSKRQGPKISSSSASLQPARVPSRSTSFPETHSLPNDMSVISRKQKKLATPIVSFATGVTRAAPKVDRDSSGGRAKVSKTAPTGPLTKKSPSPLSTESSSCSAPSSQSAREPKAVSATSSQMAGTEPCNPPSSIVATGGGGGGAGEEQEDGELVENPKKAFDTSLAEPSESASSPRPNTEQRKDDEEAAAATATVAAPRAQNDDLPTETKLWEDLLHSRPVSNDVADFRSWLMRCLTVSAQFEAKAKKPGAGQDELPDSVNQTASARCSSISSLSSETREGKGSLASSSDAAVKVQNPSKGGEAENKECNGEMSRPLKKRFKHDLHILELPDNFRIDTPGPGKNDGASGAAGTHAAKIASYVAAAAAAAASGRSVGKGGNLIPFDDDARLRKKKRKRRKEKKERSRKEQTKVKTH